VKVSLIVTMRNEMEHLREWWESLVAQSRAPDELVVVDGGSDDGTWEFLSSVNPPFPLVLESFPGSNISQGRNRAVELSSCPVIAVTDGGCVLRPRWLEKLVAPLEEDPGLQLVAGAYLPHLAPEVGFFQRLSACVTLPRLGEVDEKRFLPSARSVAYRREVWEAVGGYPEWLAYGEDMFFNHAWRRMGIRYRVEREAVVEWRLRPDLASLFRQYFRYAWGDGRSGMYGRRHALRYAVYAWVLPGAAFLGRHRLYRLATPCAAAAYAGRRWLRVPEFFAGRPTAEKLAALPGVPLMLFLVDLAKMAGYPAGVAARLREGRGEGD